MRPVAWEEKLVMLVSVEADFDADGSAEVAVFLGGVDITRHVTGAQLDTLRDAALARQDAAEGGGEP